MKCDDCGKNFSSERDLLEHRLEAHGDDMSSHDKDEIKTRLNKLDSQKQEDSIPTRTLAAYIIGALGIIAIGYGLFTSGIIQASTSAGPGVSSSGGNVTVGPAGSTHDHAQFSVTVDGRRIDFSQPQYQMQGQRVHFENGDGSTIHKHATGVTVGYSLETLGMGINSTCLQTRDGATHCEGENSELTTVVNGQEIEKPASHVISDGQEIEIVYSTESS